VSDDPGRDLQLPTSGAPIGAAVVLHPHPAMGGDRHHPLVVALADGLAADGLATLRIDLHDPDIAAATDRLEAVATDLVAEVDTYRLVLVGYSWGSVVCAAASPVGLVGRVLVAPPVRSIPLSAPADDVPALLLVPEHDQHGGPDATTAAVAGWPDATVEMVPGADHFLAGAIARITARTVAWVADVV
jgi:alpha/beta superfamily hydrolase